jgi:uncharacterized protein
MENRLRNETSPYLLQHADNPVHWQPWDEQALAAARDADRPILLSIGYSACHWCHVMAHESFEDADTAKLMNELFVSIKVDREERPDLDRIYQLAHQLFTGRGGGWPLTAFLAPDSQLPIAVGTYFPRQARYGMPAFSQILERVSAYYREHRDEVTSQGNALVDALQRMDDRASADLGRMPDDTPLRAAGDALQRSFDPRHGGFGGAPKFPRASSLDLALALWHDDVSAGNEASPLLDVVTHTLTAMAARGLYDHLGGGFFRYAVDEAWAIPHFEKMLYDNASLLALYADAFAATGDPDYAVTAAHTADWLMRDMHHPGGGWYAALDADSEGEEGRFYLWTREQFDAVLPASHSEVAKTVFGLYAEPNFEGTHWHLHRKESPSTVAAVNGVDPEQISSLLDRARDALLTARNRRPAPGRDDKLLVAWNALTIRAMARAARRLERPDLYRHALEAVDFIRSHLWDGARLKSVYKDGRARFPAYLDDYAFLIDALLELLQCRWRNEDLEFAMALADTLLEHFADPRGGFCFVADDHEALIHRPRSFADEAIPSGNGVALGALLTLGHLLDEPRYMEAAERGLQAAAAVLDSHPDSYAATLLALATWLQPPQLIIIRGSEEATATAQRTLGERYHPRRLVFCIPPDAGPLPGLLDARKPAPDGLMAYLCTGTQCEQPVTELDSLLAALDH